MPEKKRPPLPTSNAERHLKIPGKQDANNDSKPAVNHNLQYQSISAAVPNAKIGVKDEKVVYDNPANAFDNVYDNPGNAFDNVYDNPANASNNANDITKPAQNTPTPNKSSALQNESNLNYEASSNVTRNPQAQEKTPTPYGSMPNQPQKPLPSANQQPKKPSPPTTDYQSMPSAKKNSEALPNFLPNNTTTTLMNLLQENKTLDQQQNKKPISPPHQKIPSRAEENLKEPMAAKVKPSHHFQLPSGPVMPPKPTRAIGPAPKIDLEKQQSASDVVEEKREAPKPRR